MAKAAEHKDQRYSIALGQTGFPAASYQVPKNKMKHVIVASHRRSGTHLLIDTIVSNISGYITDAGRNHLVLDHLTSRVEQQVSLEDFMIFLEQKPRVIKTHSHADITSFFENSKSIVKYVESLFSDSRVIYVYRDGRDVLTSLYFYMRRFSPTVQNKTLSEFIRMSNDVDVGTCSEKFDRIDFWKFHVESWLEQNSILLISYEQLITAFNQTLRKISDFLNQPIKDKIKDVRMQPGPANRFVYRAQKLFSRIAPVWYKGVKRSEVCFRKGKPEDWRNYFTDSDLQYFCCKAGDLVKKLGYTLA